MSGKKEVIGVATAELGYLEKSLSAWKKYNTQCLYDKTKYAGDGNVQKYAWETGHYKTVGWAPWCMSFVVWCLMAVLGKDNANTLLCGMFNSASTMDTKNAMVKAGRQVALSKAEEGDIVFRSRNGGGHVGIVTGRSSDGKIITVEGNSSSSDITSWNGGAVVKHIGASWEWCCRPDWAKVENTWHWVEENGIWYYQDKYGNNKHGWEKIKEIQGNKRHWYYFNDKGQMLTGAKWVNGKYCCFMDSGPLEGALCRSENDGYQYIWDVE